MPYRDDEPATPTSVPCSNDCCQASGAVECKSFQWAEPGHECQKCGRPLCKLCGEDLCQKCELKGREMNETVTFGRSKTDQVHEKIKDFILKSGLERMIALMDSLEKREIPDEANDFIADVASNYLSQIIFDLVDEGRIPGKSTGGTE